MKRVNLPKHKEVTKMAEETKEQDEQKDVSVQQKGDGSQKIQQKNVVKRKHNKRGLYKTKKKMIEDKKKARNRKFKILAFLAPPIIVSLVSMFHSYDLLMTVSRSALATALAISYEIMVLALLIISPELIRLGRIAKLWSYLLVALLALFLAFSNVYAAWVTIPDEVVMNVAQLTGLPEVGLVTKRLITVYLGSLITILALSLIPMYSRFISKDR